MTVSNLTFCENYVNVSFYLFIFIFIFIQNHVDKSFSLFVCNSFLTPRLSLSFIGGAGLSWLNLRCPATIWSRPQKVWNMEIGLRAAFQFYEYISLSRYRRWSGSIHSEIIARKNMWALCPLSHEANHEKDEVVGQAIMSLKVVKY